MCITHMHSEDGQPGSMEYITKHNSKQKWERYAGENRWIDFLVSWHTICIDDFLEDPSEFIQSEVCRLYQAFDGIWALLEGQTIHIAILFQGIYSALKIIKSWHPNKSISDSLTVLEHIHVGMNSSLFEDKELIDFNDTHISVASCVGCQQVVFVHTFGLPNHISSLFFLLLLFSDLNIDSFQGNLKHSA